ncbi:MAG: hypothetical protein ACKOHI_06360, partial [Phycisphaerales bacterium]
MASDKVKGQVTVNLFEVPLEEALNAILEVNGLAWKREGDFIYVLTQAEVDAQRGREARVFTLQFLSAEDTIAFIKPVLSEQGSAVALGKVEAGFEATILTVELLHDPGDALDHLRVVVDHHLRPPGRRPRRRLSTSLNSGPSRSRIAPQGTEPAGLPGPHPPAPCVVRR